MMNLNQLTQAGNFLSSIGSMGNFQNYVPKQDIVTVNGLSEARDFKLNKGERVALIDSNADILYIKECDDIGKYSLKVYECKEITDRYEKENTPAVISRAELDDLKTTISDLKNLLGGAVNGKHNVPQDSRH